MPRTCHQLARCHHLLTQKFSVARSLHAKRGKAVQATGTRDQAPGNTSSPRESEAAVEMHAV